jgi:hypothetical protein
MKSSVKSTVELTRHSDTGDTVTWMKYAKGMPTTLIVEQMSPTKHVQRIEMTLKEARFFNYALNEFRNFDSFISQMDKDDDDD